MQELLIATDRKTRLRVTALGGAIIGLAIGVLCSSVVGFVLLERQQAASILRETTTRSELEGRLAVVMQESKAKHRAVSGAPLLYVARLADANGQAVHAQMEQFPAFKTDPYKILFTELNALVGKQRKLSKELVEVLSNPSVDAATVCQVASTAPVGAPLWANDTISLSRDGWRGVAP